MPFANLIAHLSEVLPRDQKHRDVLLARGFFVWKSQELSRAVCPIVSRKDIIQNFMAFCRSANIDCVEIYGKIKGSKYQVGDTEVISWGAWIAFRGDGRWHLLEPWWCLSAVAGYNIGGKVSLESDGITDVQEIDQSSGTQVYCFDEDEFCVDPEVFLVTHFPDDPQWQLRSDTKDSVTLEEWLNMPYLRREFFKHSLHLISEESCRLNADNGRCRIVFSGDRDFFKSLLFSYKIYLRSSDASDLSASTLPRIVIPERLENENLYIYDIGCPVEGVYFLDIFTTDVKCCEFMIECKEPNPFCRKAPVDTGTLGFGFGPKAKGVGLYRPSERGAMIFVDTFDTFDSEEFVDQDHIEDKKISFKVDQDAISKYEFASSMHESEREEPVTTTLNIATRNLVVNLPLKYNTEYALSLRTRKKDSGEKYETVMYYLVTSDQEEKADSDKLAKQITERKKDIKLEEKTIRNLTLRKKLDEIKAAIEEIQTKIEQ